MNEFRTQTGGMTPDSRATMDAFLQQLRTGSGPRSKTFLQGEEEVVFIENEGTAKQRPVKGGELPKFMNRAEYFSYFGKKIDQVKLSVLPTEATVESADGIHDINSAVFVPPMAMITSLVSVLANTAALLLILLSAIPLATKAPWGRRLNTVITYVGPLFTVGFIAAVIAAAPSSIFTAGSPMHSLEAKMQQQVGWPGVLWSRAAAIQLGISKNINFDRRI